MQGVSSTTLEAFVSTNFGIAVDQFLYLVGLAFPYLLGIGALYFAWRIFQKAVLR